MNKTILITGASGGIGTQLIKPLTDAGYHLILHYYTHLETLNKILDEVKPKTKVICLQADLTKESEVEKLISTALNVFDSIDILVNNAGVSSSAISWKLEKQQWDHTIAANLTTTFLVTKHVLPLMRKNNWGRIINNSSVVGQTGMAGTSAYAASKAGIIGFTKSVAKEVSNKNITVNALSYGYMNAGMIEELDPELQEVVKNSIPQKRFGDVNNIAEAITFLASENTDYITGQTININGGLF